MGLDPSPLFLPVPLEVPHLLPPLGLGHTALSLSLSLLFLPHWGDSGSPSALCSVTSLQIPLQTTTPSAYHCPCLS